MSRAVSKSLLARCPGFYGEPKGEQVAKDNHLGIDSLIVDTSIRNLLVCESAFEHWHLGAAGRRAMAFA
jgi:hypothetical protein